MKLTSFEQPALIDRITAEIVAKVTAKPTAVVCIAAGDTPIPVMHRLVTLQQSGAVDLSQTQFLGLDEWVGLTPTTPGTCIETLTTNLFAPLNIPADHIHFFNTAATDLPAELTRIDDFVATHGIDYVLLGIGMNGHIGFNEPGVALDTNAQVVPLSETTKRVMHKYFATDYPLTQGMTLGFKQLLAAKRCVLMATGAAKAAIVAETMVTAPTADLPASVLHEHENADFYVDTAAANL